MLCYMFEEYGYKKNFLAENINISDIPDEPYVFDIVSPNKPSKPSGPTNGNPGKEYTYSSITTNPSNEQLYYKWDWGDGTTLRYDQRTDSDVERYLESIYNNDQTKYKPEKAIYKEGL